MKNEFPIFPLFVSNFAVFLRIFDEFVSGFRDKFQKRVTCVAFSIEFPKTHKKITENSGICENYSLLFIIIHYYSLLFIRVLSRAPGVRPLPRRRAPGARTPLLRRRRRGPLALPTPSPVSAKLANLANFANF